MIKKLSSIYLRASGWKFINVVPEDLKSFVVVGAPHTSNYDFFMAMALADLMKRNARFVIKSSWLKFPLSLIMHRLGAIGIDRRLLKKNNKANYTDSIAELFKNHSNLVLMIAPEATRSPNPKWKTGFYYIAQKAGVPIVLGYANYAKKEVGLGLVVYPSDFDKDMKTIKDFYKNIQGKRPENFKLDERY